MSEDAQTGARIVEGVAGSGHVEVMHGDRCVALVLSDGDGAASGGLVLDGIGARLLAQLLVLHAVYAEEGR